MFQYAQAFIFCLAFQFFPSNVGSLPASHGYVDSWAPSGQFWTNTSIQSLLNQGCVRVRLAPVALISRLSLLHFWISVSLPLFFTGTAASGWQSVGFLCSFSVEFSTFTLSAIGCVFSPFTSDHISNLWQWSSWFSWPALLMYNYCMDYAWVGLGDG